MVLLWNALVTLRFCWAIREFTLVWIEIIFEILSNLGAGILPDADLFGLVGRNMSGGGVYYLGGGRWSQTGMRVRRRDAENAEISAEKQKRDWRKERRRGRKSPSCARMDKAEPHPTSHTRFQVLPG